VGLGNPGPEYLETRHNAGFRLADHLASRWRLGEFRRGDRARTAEGDWNSHRVRLVKPMTYMNRSGAVLAPLRASPDFDAGRDLLILVDDVALPLGRFRLRGAGSSGGHNGLKSIEGALQRQDYARLRIGVGPAPPDLEDLADFVLAEFEPEEREALGQLLEPLSEAVECWLEEGVEKAMSKFNR
jgi:peptidyl-tRNA hydrolase, PTH1 family